MLLEMRDVSVAFGDKTVVHALNLSVDAGQRLALVGESGSGKTVSALSLLKLVDNARVSGAVHFDPDGTGPRDLLQLSPAALRGVRGREIAVVFQEPMTALNPVFSVGEQIAEVLMLHQGLGRQAAWLRAVALLERMGIADPARRARAYAHQLSGGQRQRVMIAMALACQPRLLIADEPTTALDLAMRHQILDLLAELQADTGMAVLLITHDLPLVRRFAQYVAVMQQGRLVEQGHVAEVFTHPQHSYTQSLLSSHVLPNNEDAASHMNGASEPVLSARDVAVAYPVPSPGWRMGWRTDRFLAVQGVTFDLSPGRTVGVMGESGSGKSTLAMALLGLQPHEGQLRVDGQAWRGRWRADRALRAQIQIVFQDPYAALSPRMTVEQLVGEGLTLHEQACSAEQRRERVLTALAEVGLTEAEFPGLLRRYPHAFSGGQRQRLALARALMVDPRILVLDEPTSALDVTVQRQVLMLLKHLQTHRQLAYFIITHDIDVIRAMAHDVLVMRGGKVLEQGPVQQILKQPEHEYTKYLVKASHGEDQRV